MAFTLKRVVFSGQYPCSIRSFLRFSVLFISTVFLIYFNKDIADAWATFLYRSLITNSSICTRCSGKYLPHNITSSFDPWLVVEDRDLLLFSAYYDSLRPAFIRTIGIRHVHYSQPVFCLLYLYDGGSNTWILSVRRALVHLADEMQECVILRLCAYNPYTTFFVDCRLNRSEQDFIQYYNSQAYVSIITNKNLHKFINCTTAFAFRKIEVRFLGNHKNEVQRTKESDDNVNLAICVSPTFNWTDVDLFKLFLNYYISQGVEKFLLYKRWWSNDVESLLRSSNYARYIEVIYWPPFPKVSFADLNDGTSVHYHGQITAINDCVYRMKYNANYVMSIDLDEFLILKRRSWTIDRLLRDQEVINPGWYGLIIRNRYVHFDAKNGINNKTRVKMSKTTFPFTLRTKYILKPRKADKMGIHLIWQYVDSKYFKRRQIYIPSSVASFYHWKPLDMIYFQDGFSEEENETLSSLFAPPS